MCVWGGGGRCGLHKDEIMIYNREGRNKERGGGGGVEDVTYTRMR